MSQNHYSRELMVAAHRHDLEQEAAYERLAAMIERPSRGARNMPVTLAVVGAALVALAVIAALVASNLLGFDHIGGSQVSLTVVLHAASTVLR